MNGAVVPTVKVEHAPSPHVKPEFEDGPSPYMDEDDVYEEDAGDLDFTQAQQQIWLSHVPRSLWETWSDLSEDDEVEIGTVRVEGSIEAPTRISLKLHDLPDFRSTPKEYVLKDPDSGRQKIKRPGHVFLFSEKNVRGYKGRSANTDEVDEDGNPVMRSSLYEQARRDAKRKESKGRFEPYARRPIPKQIALTGVVNKELDCAPVSNEELEGFKRRQVEKMLRPVEKDTISFDDRIDMRSVAKGPVLTQSEKAAITKATQAKRQAKKDARTARLPENVVTDLLLDMFKRYQYWGLRELKNQLDQPEAYVKQILQTFAFMHLGGDFNNKWQLRPEWQEKDPAFINAAGAAPVKDEPASESEPSGMDEDDDEVFEDAMKE